MISTGKLNVRSGLGNRIGFRLKQRDLVYLNIDRPHYTDRYNLKVETNSICPRRNSKIEVVYHRYFNITDNVLAHQLCTLYNPSVDKSKASLHHSAECVR